MDTALPTALLESSAGSRGCSLFLCPEVDVGEEGVRLEV